MNKQKTQPKAQPTPQPKPSIDTAARREQELITALFAAMAEEGRFTKELDKVKATGLKADWMIDPGNREILAAFYSAIDTGTPITDSTLIDVIGGSLFNKLTAIADEHRTPPSEAEGLAASIVNQARKKRLLQLTSEHADTEAGIDIALSILRREFPEMNRGGTLCAANWLQEPDPPITAIVPGLFDIGDRVAVVGQSKARKSFFAMQLAIIVATGKGFLSYEPGTPRRVLIYNGEIRTNHYRRRLRRMAKAMQVDPELLNNLIVFNDSENEEQATFDSLLKAAIEARADVVIADPAYMLIGDEIEAGNAKGSIKEMRTFAAKQITLVGVYHSAKGIIGDRQAIDRISGSGVFARDPDTFISLAEHATEENHIVMQTITRNYAPVEPVTIAFNEGAFEITDIAPVEKTSKTRPKVQIAEEQLSSCFDKERSYSDTIAHLQIKLNIGRDRARDELRRAVELGIVASEPRGRTTYYMTRADIG